MSLSLCSRVMTSRSVFVCWRVVSRSVSWARERSWLSRSSCLSRSCLRCLFARRFWLFVFVDGSFFVAESAMLCIVLVGTVSVG